MTINEEWAPNNYEEISKMTHEEREASMRKGIELMEKKIAEEELDDRAVSDLREAVHNLRLGLLLSARNRELREEIARVRGTAH